MTLALPDSIRELLAQWLTPAASKPNGRHLTAEEKPDFIDPAPAAACTMGPSAVVQRPAHDQQYPRLAVRLTFSREEVVSPGVRREANG
jgi:hypothetical protein